MGGFIAHGHHQTQREGCRRPSAEGQSEMMDDGLQPPRAPTIFGQDTRLKSLAEYAAAAQNRVTPKPARHDCQFDLSATEGEVRGAAQIQALNAAASSAAIRTKPKRL